MAGNVAAGKLASDGQRSGGEPSPLFPPVPKPTDLPKVVTEYQLAAGKNDETHEIALARDNLLVITQQTNSKLVKVKLNRDTGNPLRSLGFLIGTPKSGLHGLCVSRNYPGNIWVTIQYENAIERLDPAPPPPCNVDSRLLEPLPGNRDPGPFPETFPIRGRDDYYDLYSTPKMLQRIDLPSTVAGPHVVVEDKDSKDLWVSCKDSNHIVRINHTDTSDFSVYECSPRPIFVAIHPTSGDVYASLDESSKIFRYCKETDETSEIDISKHGTTPVGLVTAPDGNLWFVLLGGRGTFGRINAGGGITWFTLTSQAGAMSGLIHLAFDPKFHRNTPLRCFLVSSSMGSVDSPNSVIRVFMDDSKVVSEVNFFLPTPYSMTHRVLLYRGGLYVTELAVSVIARVSGTALKDKKLNDASESKLLSVRDAAANYVVYGE